MSSYFYSSNSTSLFRKIPPLPPPSSYIDKHDAGLCGVQGAETIVDLLRLRKAVHHLVLAHNSLGDTGCIALFDYLSSEEGRKHQIVYISLNANGIGDAGLWAISRYLEENEYLNGLFLQNNILKGDRPIMLRFALAVNRSNLQTLSLTCNNTLGEAITTTFLPNLSAPRLSELHLSVCSLRPSATAPLLSYLTSPRAASLRTLKLNGNPLGFPAVSRIIRGLERANWSVGWVEMHACSLKNGTDGLLEGSDRWKKCEERLRVKVLERNRYLGNRAAEDALGLLPHARPALLAYAREAGGARSRLPLELVIYILSFLAPTLSAAQHLRICRYAASLDTLPSLRLSFPSCDPYTSLPAPHCLHTSWSRLSHRHICTGGSGGAGTNAFLCLACAARRMMTPVRDEERKAWLQKVGCDRFEPDTGVREGEQEAEYSVGEDEETTEGM